MFEAAGATPPIDPMPRETVLLYSDGALYGGGERYLLEVARGLPRDRYAAQMVLSEEGAVDGLAREASALGIPVTRLPAVRTLAERGPFLKVWRWFVQHRPHVLHFNLVDPRACNGAMTAAILAGHRRLVVTEHLPGAPFDALKLPFRHRLAARSTKVTIVNTDEDRDLVLTRPHHRSRVAVIPNGIPDPGVNTAARTEAARTTLGFPGHRELLVGFVGRFIPQKNPALFVEAVAKIAAKKPTVRFLMLGDGPELAPLEERVASLGLGGQLRFFGHRDDAKELVYGLDLLVSTSRYEGMPFSIIEAMHAGVPVIAQAIRGMAALVAPGATGWLVEPEDAGRLAWILEDALAHPARLERYGRAARERAIALFSAEEMCRRTAEVYASLG